MKSNKKSLLIMLVIALMAFATHSSFAQDADIVDMDAGTSSDEASLVTQDSSLDDAGITEDSGADSALDMDGQIEAATTESVDSGVVEAKTELPAEEQQPIAAEETLGEHLQKRFPPLKKEIHWGRAVTKAQGGIFCAVSGTKECKMTFDNAVQYCKSKKMRLPTLNQFKNQPTMAVRNQNHIEKYWTTHKGVSYVFDSLTYKFSRGPLSGNDHWNFVRCVK